MRHVSNRLFPNPPGHFHGNGLSREMAPPGIGLLRHPPHPLGSVHLSLRPFPMSWAFPQAEVIAPSSSGRHSPTSRLMVAQSRANHKRPSLHSILGAGASPTRLSLHALVPFSFHLQVRKCFTHPCSSEAGPLQQGKRIFIGAHQLMGLYRLSIFITLCSFFRGGIRM